MPIEQSETFRRYRAPQADGQTLVEPPLRLLSQITSANRPQSANIHYDVQGMWLGDLCARARRSLLHAAWDYTRGYRDVAFAEHIVDTPERLPIILSGHQPQLFHPGVWYKNFVLGRVARDVGGIGVHLLIDSDLCREVALRVPTGTMERPTLATVPFDTSSADMPYEERRIIDRELFKSMGARVAAAIRSLVPSPLVERLWPLVCRSLDFSSNLGEALSKGRHLLEAEWRNETLELPQSQVCQLPEFAQFAAHLFAELPRFRTAYNGALAEYRQAHRLRNRAHPVPDLAQSGEWLEAPFWIWSIDDPQRRAVFVRRTKSGIEVTDRDRRTFSLDLTGERDAANAREQLRKCALNGVKIRTRALATTLFARLVLSDLFLHGIGGAKYDQVTNLIARKFFGFDLPQYAVVSATLRLPISDESDAPPDTRYSQKLRELRYHPERCLSELTQLTDVERQAAQRLVADKRRWVEITKTPENAHARHLAITKVNEALQPFVESRRIELSQSAEREDARRQASATLNSREYSFCLYPRESIDRLLLDSHPLQA
jgi:hypothetical protein